MAFLFQRKVETKEGISKVWYIGYYETIYKEGIKKLKRYNVSTGEKSKMKAGEVLDNWKRDRDSMDKPKLIKCSDFLEEYIKISCFKKAAKHQKNIRKKFRFLTDKLADRYIHQYSTQDIDKILQMKSAEGCSQYTVKNYRADLRAGFEQARKWRYIKINPVEDSRLIQVPEPQIITYEPAEIRKFLAAANEKFKDILIFTLYTGLRAGDVVNIKLSDIDFQNKTITIGNDEHISKIQKQNSVEIAEGIIPIIQKYRMSNLEYLFESKFRRKYSVNTISNAVKRIVVKAGINRKLNHKSLRKTFATFLYEEGIHIEEISKYLHHSSVRVTKKHYAKMLRTPFTGDTNKIGLHLTKVI
jgi:integrase/recombinase XerD